MKCLITGVTGVVGKNLSKILTEQYDFDVWGCGRTSHNQSQYFSLDLNDRVAVLDMFSKNSFDLVIHCAANINNNTPYDMFINNIASTLNVVEASITAGVKKLFHTSSVPIIGEILELPITENHPTKPLTEYHLSKLHAEQIIEQYGTGKIDFINMRIPSPVGRDMPLRSVLPIFVDRIKKGDTITLSGDPRRQQNFLDIRDLASFIDKASLVDGQSGIYNVAAEKSYSNLELAEAIISKVGSGSKIENNMIEDDAGIQNWNVSTLKANKHFGYVPAYDLHETIDWIL